MILDKMAYDRIFGEIYYQKYTAKAEFLKKINLFSSWSNKKISEMLYLLEEKSYNKGAVLYKEGDTPTHVYFVQEGEIEVWILFIVKD